MCKDSVFISTASLYKEETQNPPIYLIKKRRIAADRCRRTSVYSDFTHYSTAELF